MKVERLIGERRKREESFSSSECEPNKKKKKCDMEEAENMKEKLLKRKYEIEERGRKLKVEKAVTEEAYERLQREWEATEKEAIEKNTEISKCDAELEQVNKTLNVIKEEELKRGRKRLRSKTRRTIY